MSSDCQDLQHPASADVSMIKGARVKACVKNQIAKSVDAERIAAWWWENSSTM